MPYLFWFILGTLLGSLALVIIFRFPKDQFKTSLTGRSYCPHCQHKLTALDLIPIVSFILSRGKCRYCSYSISLIYPVSEILFGLLALGIYWKFQSLGLTLINLAIADLFIIIAGIDWQTQAIVEILIIIAAILTVFSSVFSNTGLTVSLLGVLAGCGLFVILAGVSKGKWMGAGDIELGAVLGLWLGFPAIIPGLMTAFVAGSLYGIILIKTGKADMKSRVPFAPFLVLGGIVAVLFGANIVKWYLGGLGL